MKRTGAGQSPGGLHKSEANERILLHLLLLLVSYLAGKNRRTTKQDHRYRKRFRESRSEEEMRKAEEEEEKAEEEERKAEEVRKAEEEEEKV